MWNLGGSATSDNVGPQHLINIKRVAYGIKDVTAPSPYSNSVTSPQAPKQQENALLLNLVDELVSILQKSGDC
ncbi:hypothetical protein RE628_24170 [Paenibacillus sp. D2_2]|uniref:hypothetical protein n=1 Tax=Paenibacillus sp. D2_2 TaxID=3073092 RepID=UPI0028163FDD|nr:hypothetical protein [Paenibacillus sp. D2_2]WMT40299.1 hypothetical protein RE628_24170 [Paenibacillus sp. D2_2]